MDITLLSPTELEQYKRDCFLADSLDRLGISPTMAKNLREILPSVKNAEFFGVAIISENDATLLRTVAVQSIADYSAKVKAAFVAENTPPQQASIVPIQASDITRAQAQGWTALADGDRWSFEKNGRTFSIPSNEDVTNFNNILNLN